MWDRAQPQHPAENPLAQDVEQVRKIHHRRRRRGVEAESIAVEAEAAVGQRRMDMNMQV